MERLVEQLQALGMSGYEAKAYLALVAAGRPLNGYEVAKRSGVPRSTVYETLSKLVARSAAFEVRTGDESNEYLPLPPAALLGRTRREMESAIDSLQSMFKELTAPPEAHLIHSLQGRKQLLARSADLVAGARNDLFVSIWPAELDELKPLLRRAADAGVDISVVCFGEDPDPVRRTYPHRYSAPDVVLDNVGCPLLVVAADREQVVIGGVTDEDAWGVFTDDPAVVMVAVEYVRHDIAMQLLIDRLGGDSVREFWENDPELIRLRSDHGQAAAVLRRMHSAQPVDLTTSNGRGAKTRRATAKGAPRRAAQS